MDENNLADFEEVRDIDIVTTEINTLIKQYRSITLTFAVEVGRRLKEAKSLLPHGEWGTWLSEKVSFSQRTANNLMRVFEEYGDTQITLFGAVPNSHAIANLPLTHAIKLLLLPAEEREEFVETEDVAHMSVRELEEAIKAKKEAEERAEGLETKLRNMEGLLKETDATRDQIIEENRDLQEKLEEAAREAKVAQMDAEKAREDVKKAKKALKDAKANAEIPKETLDKLTAEAEEKAAAAQKEALEKKIDEANRKIAAADRRRLEAEEKYEALRQQMQISDPDVMSFKTLFEQVQDDAAKLTAAFGRVKDKNPEMAGKLGAAVAKMAEQVFGGFTA